jgi:hypothetical protein
MMSEPEFPLLALKQFLVPGQTPLVKIFEAPTVELLEKDIISWIDKSQALVLVPGPVTFVEAQTLSIALTYLPAVRPEHVE